MRIREVLALVAFSILTIAEAGNVLVCKDIKDCNTCAESYIHILGFKEDCRWCLETQSCGGPISCPIGKPVIQKDPFKCPTPYKPSAGKRYTDALGRSLFAISTAVRDSNVTACLRNVRPDISFSRSYEVECDGSGNLCKGIIAKSEEAKALYVAYKGSTAGKQVFAEMLHGLTAQLGAWEKFESQDAGVINYFHTAFYRLFIDSGMEDDLMDLMKKHKNYRIWLTGHSLGGSLASMTALHLVKKKGVDKNRVRLITFGEPRTGNIAYAKEIEENVPFRYRVIKRGDPVPNMPAPLNPAVLTAAQYNRQAMHYRYLVHYDNNMGKGDVFNVCSVADDLGCRNTALSNLADHTSYFQIDQDDFVRNHCPRHELI
ncbi:unnamed protein product [Caenorhabditis nigoni]|uniref:Fungal lipase-type domain-containing protein n=1 Tax=Caenorhabditis nigoni TaxID=1611254 RepID=A0A2G5TK23_9PELO|nr:hypothetical protein B9Z55_019809 [Caenorhabditis nigoni]